MAVRAPANRMEHAKRRQDERARALPHLPSPHQHPIPPSQGGSSAVNGLPLTVETGWPVTTLWPNAQPHRNPWKLGSARKAAKTEAFWATKYVLPLDWAHDGSRLKLTIEACPELSRARDDDNLIAACKPLRDGIAQALGIDDKLFDIQPVIWGGKHGRGGRLFFTIGDRR